MIPFALFTRTVLDSGIVRVEFKLSQWTQRDNDWVYHIPNSVHQSGDVPKVHIVDKANHTLTGVSVEYNYAGMITLVAQQPILNFTGYFMGQGFIIPDNKPIKFLSIGDRSETFYDTRTQELYFMSTVGTVPLVLVDNVNVKFASVYSDMVYYIDNNDTLWIHGQNVNGQKGIGTVSSAVETTRCYEGVKEAYGGLMIPRGSAEYNSAILTLSGDVLVAGNPSSYETMGVGVGATATWFKLNIPEKIVKLNAESLHKFCIGESGKIYAYAFNYYTAYDTNKLTGNVYEQSIPVGSPVFAASVGTYYEDLSTGVVYSAGFQENIGRPAGNGWQPTNLPSGLKKVVGNFIYSGGVGNTFALTYAGELWMTGVLLPPDAHTTKNTWEKYMDGVTDVYAYSNAYTSSSQFAILIIKDDGSHVQLNLGGGSVPDLYQLPLN